VKALVSSDGLDIALFMLLASGPEAKVRHARLLRPYHSFVMGTDIDYAVPVGNSPASVICWTSVFRSF